MPKVLSAIMYIFVMYIFFPIIVHYLVHNVVFIS